MDEPEKKRGRGRPKGRHPGRHFDAPPIPVRFTQEQLDQIKERAKAEGETLGRWVRDACLYRLRTKTRAENRAAGIKEEEEN